MFCYEIREYGRKGLISFGTGFETEQEDFWIAKENERLANIALSVIALVVSITISLALLL